MTINFTHYSPFVRRLSFGLLLATFSIVFGGAIAQAQSNGGQSGLSFLKIGMGARSAGLGGAFTAIGDDASAMYWNPAGLAGRENSEVMLAHHSWLQDVSLEYGALAGRLNENLGFGVGFTYVNYGAIQGFDINDRPTGAVPSVYDYAASVGLGARLSDNLRIGATAKHVTQSLGDVRASGVAGDFGVLLGFSSISFGATVSNVGQKMVFVNEGVDLPMTTRLGVAISPFGSSLVNAFDVELPKGGDMVARFGVEYGHNQSYFLRGGYSFFPTQDERDLGASMSLGAGYRLRNYEIDYSFSPEQNLNSESVHRFSLSLRFGG